MKTYELNVRVDVPHFTYVEVEAETRDEAFDLAETRLQKYYEDYDGWEADWSVADGLCLTGAIREIKGTKK